MCKRSVAGIAAILLAFVTTPARAWLRMHCEDAVVVERSEVIAVARLKRDSIRYVPHQRKPHEGRSWEHHAVLIISEVLKGTLDEREIPIIIHYGLTPVVGGYVEREGFMINYRSLREDYPKDVIEIFDTGSSAVSFSPCLTDAGKDNLWFLRRRSGTYGRKPVTGNFGIASPQDVQQLSMKDYFLSYLARDPEKAVKGYVAEHPKLAKRAESYLDHLEIGRILKTADAKTRIESLLPYYAKRHWYGSRHEAEEAIMACGEAAMPYLMEMFQDSTDHGLRSHIIQTWAKLKSDACVDLLVDLLKRHDDFWAKQQLKADWWNSGSKVNGRRREIYTEVYYGVVTLEQIGDARARDAIEITRQRWKAINFSNSQIVESCEAALRRFSESE
ncbi:MAG: hypothetical protein ACYTKD_17015 [Planctomycetota bacterium]|jgi:hypothetical protein